MKALSIKQPYADLIIKGKKKIELRKWNTKFRGEFLVHASIKPDVEECAIRETKPEELDKGAIIGSVTLKDVKCYDTFEKITEDMDLIGVKSDIIKHIRLPMHGFMLERPEQLEVPIPFKGQLGFWDFKKKKDDD